MEVFKGLVERASLCHVNESNGGNQWSIMTSMDVGGEVTDPRPRDPSALPLAAY